MDADERRYLEAHLKGLEQTCARIRARLNDERQTSLLIFMAEV